MWYVPGPTYLLVQDMLRRKDRQYTAFLKFLSETGIMGKLSPSQRTSLLAGSSQAKADQHLCEGLLDLLGKAGHEEVGTVIVKAAHKTAEW